MIVWQSIESAPLDGTEVLVWGNDCYAVAHWDSDVKQWRDFGEFGWGGMHGDDGNQPTHWSPLTPPPAKKV